MKYLNKKFGNFNSKKESVPAYQLIFVLSVPHAQKTLLKTGLVRILIDVIVEQNSQKNELFIWNRRKIFKCI